MTVTQEAAIAFQDTLETQRHAYARALVSGAGIENPRLEKAFATIPRERFLPPPPWTAIEAGTAVTTADPMDLYRNVLVVLDPARGINNGEPALHAVWLAMVDPQPGERVIHVGVGGGYYTAILARLVGPDGWVDAYEIHEDLAEFATQNLMSCASVAVHAKSAIGRPLPPADVIYVNAGVLAPDPSWLRALEPGGRLIFPWQPREGWGPALLVTRCPGGFAAAPVMRVGFIPCSGQMTQPSSAAPSEEAMAATRSVWFEEDRRPDSTATAVYGEVWFSSERAS